MGRRTLRMLAGALAVTALAAAPAHAAAGLEVGMEDERLLLSEPGRAAAVVAAWQALGVDTVRLHARWYATAPGLHRTTRPAGFRASDPDDPRYDWGPLDQAIDLVVAAGMKPMLSITGPAPWWATAEPRLRKSQRNPRPSAFAQFAGATARRYGDRVDRYLIWNEPNQPGWLQPQSDCGGRGRARVCVPVAPHLYRELVRAAVPAIAAEDPDAQVLMGELAPIGDPPRTDNTALAPLPFLRAMGCVDASYRPLRTGRCAGFRAAAADALGYHPHGRLQPADRANPDRTEAQIADLPRLLTVLDKLSARGRLRAPAATGRRFDVYLTEFGYQTDPPDRAVGVSLAQQARYLQQAAYIAWRTPRVRNLTHYQWEDELVREDGPSGFGGWQSGLLYHDGDPKPAFQAFPAPFVYDAARGRLWGQVRPGGATTITLEERRPGAPAWRAVATAPTGGAGYWTSTHAVDETAEYRVTWTDAAALLSGLPAARATPVLDPDASRRDLRAAAPGRR